MRKGPYRGLFCAIILLTLFLSSFELISNNNLLDIHTPADIEMVDDGPPQEVFSIFGKPHGDSNSLAPSQDESLSTNQSHVSILQANNVEMISEDSKIPYWKIEPMLLSTSKNLESVKVIITSIDMNQVRELLGHEKGNTGSQGKRHDSRLETSILEVQSRMLTKIASLESVVSVQSYKLPEPPQFPEDMEGEGEPTMWNAVKYHGAEEAWNLGFNGSGVKVAVLDTGVDFGHPDLNGTQARDENPSSPYFGWPLAFDSRSMLSYLDSGGQGFTGSGGEDNWYSDTSTTDTDSNGNGTLDATGYNVSGIISQSGIYHIGKHPDTRLRNLYGNYVDVLVVDEILAGVYDTVYVNLNNDNNFTDEKPCRKGDEVSTHELTGDSIPDRSGGMIYFIADGSNSVPYSDIIAAENGYSLPIPANGTLVAFMINDPTESGGNHGTLCASAIAGQGIIASGRVKGTAPKTKIISVGNIYHGGNWFDSYYFAVEGYDGIPGTGDEANIVSCSFGDSEVVQGGWDFESRFVDNLTTNYAPNVTFAIASGNGGYGYGTVASPGSSPGVITVGAALNKRVTEVVYWSNRGPNSIGQLDPDVVSVGVDAYGDQPLNQRTTPNGNNAYQTWSGTSLATPVTAGIVALIYDAYFQSNSKYPSSELAREILMSTADNLNYDPLAQGAGFSNATRATKVANNISGLLLSPSFWSAGSYRGLDYDAFTHIMHPGEMDNITVSVSNADQNNAVDVYISDYILSRTNTSLFSIEANKSLEDSSTNRPDFFIPLNDSKNGISHIPYDTALLKVSGYMPWDEFDPDFDYFQENRFSITLYNWIDSNGNGSYWNDVNGDGVAQTGEMEFSELSSICSSSITATTQEARMHDPLVRIDDGLIVGIFHYHSSAAPNITHIYIQSQCYNRTDWNWLDTDTTNLAIGPGGNATFNASLMVPSSTPIGLYEGLIALNDTRNETVMPVIVNVASKSEKFTFGGNTLSTDLYANDQVFGAFRWGWRYEGGDWRFYFTDIPDSFALNPGTKIVADIKWDNYPTDIDVFILGGLVDSYSNEMPSRYGPYTMGIKGRSYDSYWFGGRFRFNTTTNGPREIISADLSQGLNEIILHNVLYAGQSFSENLTGTIGIVNVTPYPWDVGFIDNVANLTGTQQFTVLSSFNLSGISVKAFGVYPPMEYPNEIIYQNDPNDKTTSNWSREFDVSGAEYLRVNISSQSSMDIDLFLLRDINGNGVPNWGSEQVAESTSPYAEEEIILTVPTDGKYWVFVHGWNVPSSPSVFDCYIEVVYGNDINVTDVPIGSISAGEMAYFNASYSLPPIGGEYRGIIVIGLTGLGDTINVPFMAELEGERPMISNLQPVNDSWITDNQPIISAQYNDSGSGINLSRVFIYVDGMNHTGNATITSGSINLISLLPLSEGLHTVDLIVTDMFGNKNSTTWQFSIDSQKPIIILNTPQNNSAILPGIILDFSIVDLNPIQVNYSVNGGSNISFSAPFNIPTLGWTADDYIIQINAIDLVGNSNSSWFFFIIDPVKPTISDLQPLNNSCINSSLLIIGAQYNGSGSDIDLSMVFIYIDGKNQTDNASVTSGSITYTPTSPLSEDNHTVYLIVTDMAGNQNSTSWRFFIDSKNPTAEAGLDKVADEDEIINLDGSLSWDENGIYNLTWDFGDGFFGYGMNPSHSYPQSGTYIVILTVWDIANNSAVDTLTVHVNNVAPFAEGGDDQIIDEGGTAFFNGNASYDTPSDMATLIYTWYFDDGAILSGVTVSHDFVDNGVYNVTLVVQDDNGYTDSDTVNVTVNNVLPIANAGGPYTGNEGIPLTFIGSAKDPGADTFMYEWDFDDSDGVTFTDATGPNPSWAWPDDFSGFIYLRVTDDDGGVGTAMASITINNMAPNANAGGPYSGNENSSVTLTGSAADSGTDSFIYEWDMDDNGLYNDATGESPSWTWNDDGIYVINLRVTDDDGDVDFATTTVTISNIAPTANAGGPYERNESTPINFSGTQTDPSPIDTFTYLWDFGDGKISTLQNPMHVYADNGIYTVTFTVTDDDGGVHTDGTIAIVYNIPPEIEALGDQLTAIEDDIFFIKINATDAEGDTLTFSDNSELFTIDPINGFIEFIPTNDDIGLKDITITVSDDDGGTSTIILLINILNENDPPVLEEIGPQIAVEDQQYSLTALASDIDTDDVLTFSDDTNVFDIDPNTGVVSFVPINEDVGIYLITITVQDVEGEKDSETFTLTILNTNDAPVLSSISNQYAKVGQKFTYTANASDIDDTTLLFSDDSDLFTINPVTGMISFIPKKGDEGLHIITITVTDYQGDKDSQTMILEIEGIPDEESQQETDWLSLLLPILIIILIILFLMHIWMHKKRESKEEEPIIIEPEVKTEQLPLFPEFDEGPPPPPPDFEEPPPPPPY